MAHMETATCTFGLRASGKAGWQESCNLQVASRHRFNV